MDKSTGHGISCTSYEDRVTCTHFEILMEFRSIGQLRRSKAPLLIGIDV